MKSNFKSKSRFPKCFKDLSLPKFKDVLGQNVNDGRNSPCPSSPDSPTGKIDPALRSIGGKFGNDVAYRIQTNMKNKKNAMRRAALTDSVISEVSEKEESLHDTMTSY